MDKNCWNNYDEASLKELEEVNARYIDYLSRGKTEREVVTLVTKDLIENGYRDLEEFKKSGEKLKAGDKVFYTMMEKSLAIFHIGSEPLEAGMNILGAHIDSPRLDVKQNPLYENEDFAYFDTHYYGGIRKYQWLTIPLALHGVICKADGTKVTVALGEEPGDPRFVITDLLPHLAQRQVTKTVTDAFDGENLDMLVGSRPLAEEADADGKGEDDKKDASAGKKVRENILKLLKEKYDITEEDFTSAELEIVPAGPAYECGFDRSLVLGYGQDDRVCAFTSFFAMMETPATRRTNCCILVDKEEIGSVGATGMHSQFFENVIAELVALEDDESALKVARCMQNSRMLSSDVNAAFDPLFADVFEKRSASFAGRGLVFSKFTGSRGKSGSNDANAEYIAFLRHILDEDHVQYQFAELGRVDIGGGGTIAYIMANYGMDVIDSGVAVLSMHAPWEVTSKADVYEAYKGYKSFLKAE